MITFHFTGEPFPSIPQQQEDKKFFLEKLGPFKDEFDSKDGIVTFNYSYPDTDNNRVAFVLGPKHGDLSDFIMRWNEHIRALHGDAGNLS